MLLAKLQIVIDRLEFIRGNVIADQKRDAVQQINELLDILAAEELKMISDEAEKSR